MKTSYEQSLDESNTDLDGSSAYFNEAFFSHTGRHTKKSHGWMTLALMVILGIIFIILGILTGILFGHYSTMNDELSVLKYNVSDPVIKNDVSELWKSVSNIMGDLSKIKDRVDITEGTCTTCPAGWKLIKSNCYYFSTKSETWERSKDMCAERNGILLVIKNSFEMSSLLPFIKQGRYWLGLKRNPDDLDMWEWTDGSPLTYSNWNEGEPNNDRNNEHCAEIMGGVQSWNDLPCSNTATYICKGIWIC
ncbi:perlucin-like protein [Bufo gargarizans]|uniref:perlucin-like protein n=1 Tax=Bufo gargarizans TaxID=30331 RepID=UPI001CF2ADB6|nr:perlucin-like protein [Bufo gargarizans]